MTAKTLTLSDHTRIELLLGVDGLFRGLGDITVRGVPLRNGGVPLRFHSESRQVHRALVRATWELGARSPATRS